MNDKKNLETEFYIFHEALQNIDKLLIRFKKERFEEKLVLEILLEVLIEKIYVAYDDKDREVGRKFEKDVSRRIDTVQTIREAEFRFQAGF